MHLIGGWHIELRAWNPPRRRQVYLPNGLLLQPVLSQIFRNLGCRRQLIDGCESLSVAPGAEGIVQFISRQRLGLLLIFCHQPMKPSIPAALSPDAEATGSSSCRVVSRSLVEPANTIVAKHIAARSSWRQSRAISVIVEARPGIL